MSLLLDAAVVAPADPWVRATASAAARVSARRSAYPDAALMAPADPEGTAAAGGGGRGGSGSAGLSTALGLR